MNEKNELPPFARRLRSLRGSETRLAFAQRIGESDSTLGNYERGTRIPPADFLARLKIATGVDLNWLVSEGTTSSTEVTNDELPDIVRIPRFEIRAAAGAGALALSESIASYFTVERDWLRRMMPGWAPSNAQVGLVEVNGDSMYPTLSDGDLVIAISNPPERVVDNGGIFFVRHNGHLRVKRLHVDMRSGDISLLSDNDRYPVETVKREHLEHELQILAMVFIRVGKLNQ